MQTDRIVHFQALPNSMIVLTKRGVLYSVALMPPKVVGGKPKTEWVEINLPEHLRSQQIESQLNGAKHAEN